MSAGQEKALLSTSLSCLLPGLRNKRTTVELRDESYVTGRVVHADGFMNITLEEVTLTDARGVELHFESFFVQSRLIRYVQIPQAVDIGEMLAASTAGRGRAGRGRGEMSRHRAKIMDSRDERRKEDLLQALRFKEEWRRDREELERRQREEQQ